jgi:hypothetical protein
MVAQAKLARGDLPGAVAAVEELEPMLAAEPAMSVTGLETYAVSLEVRLHTLMEDPKDSSRRKAVASGVSSLAKFARQYPVAAPRLATLKAALAGMRGKLSAADKGLRVAEELAEQRGMPIERAKARAWRARLLGTAGTGDGLREELAGGWGR